MEINGGGVNLGLTYVYTHPRGEIGVFIEVNMWIDASWVMQYITEPLVP